jgi:HEAT repeat protein
MNTLLILGAAMLLLPGNAAGASAQDKEKVAQLIDEVKSGDPKAAHALGQMGVKAKDAIPTLIAALDTKPEPGESLPDNAALALSKIGPVAVPALIDVLKSKRKRTWPHAATALKQLGIFAKDAVPALTEVVKQTEDRLTLSLAIDALGAVGPDAKSAVPQLLDVLRSDKAEAKQSRTHAVVALGKIGPAAVDAMPVLEKLRGTASPTLRVHIDDAVALIGGKK